MEDFIQEVLKSFPHARFIISYYDGTYCVETAVTGIYHRYDPTPGNPIFVISAGDVKGFAYVLAGIKDFTGLARKTIYRLHTLMGDWRDTRKDIDPTRD